MIIDLGLPDSIPRNEDALECDDITSHVNLYIHADITNPDLILEISKLFSRDGCSDNLGDAGIPLDVHHDFIGRPISDALEHHQEAVKTRSDLNTNRFVCLVDANWGRYGAVIVGIGEATRDANDDEGKKSVRVQKLKVPPAEIGSFLINRAIGNVDWEDYDEELEDRWHGNGWAPETPYTEEYGDDNASNDWEADEPWLHDQTDESYSDGSNANCPYSDYYIALYAIPEVDFTKAMIALDPAYGPNRHLSQRVCRPSGRVPNGPQSEMLAEAARLQPMRCGNNALLHPNYFFIIDSMSYEEDGILLVRLDWDTSQVTDSMSQRASIGSSAPICSKRIQFSPGDCLTEVNCLHRGWVPWKHNHKTFIAYPGPTNKRAENYVKALDSKFSRRMEGSERFVCAETDLGDDVDNIGEHLNAAVRDHWDDTKKSEKFIRETRFLETLHREYFVFSNAKLTSKAEDKERMVMIVKPDAPVGERRQAQSYTTLQCSAGEAYDTLCALVEGKTVWHGQADGHSGAD